MNKVLAEAIAGLIPHKMTRNRWRGLLRYGLTDAVRLLHQLRQPHAEPEHYLCVCAIAKNEGSYFEEWIEWHLQQGVQKFYIYDNESTDNTRQVLDPYIRKGIVEYIPWPGYRRQLAAYDHCLAQHRYDARWIAFIDLDEFIVPVQDDSIPQFLCRMEQYAAVEINWLIYGSSGQKERAKGGVMERFRRHSQPEHPLNRHVKSIVNPRRVFNMIGCHEACRISGLSADSHGLPIMHHFRERTPQQDVIRINHYAVRSLEEFREKQQRGRASGTRTTVPMEYFTRYDLNDLEDETATPTKTKRLRLRNGCAYENENENAEQPRIVVSMTSFPAAITYATQAIRSLLAGSVLPDRLVLYLTLSQFREGELPEELVQLAETNPRFEIRDYPRDIRSYRKLIPALTDFPEALIVTVDDDVHYHRHMLRDLLALHERHPHAVLAHRAKRIHWGHPYRQWTKYRWYHFLLNRIHRSYLNLQTGVGGVLYPPHALRQDMMNEELFTQLAPSTDDIWFWAAGVLNGYPVIPVPFGRNKPRGLHKPRALSLKTTNFRGGTDRNLAALQAICKHYPELEQKIRQK